MVFAANNMLSTRDIDGGFLRRICFVNFPITFVNEPKRKNERLRDPGLQKKLLKELPGILNWALQGLKALNEQGNFTGTTDQERLIRELEMINDPIAAFVDDVLVPYPDRYKAMQNRDNIYNDYKKWCNESNSVPMSSRWFWPRLRQKVNVTEVREAFTRKASITLKN
jgi:putative DNA primase/helicase